MADESDVGQGGEAAREERQTGRRDFLKGLQKWSAIVIGGAVLGHLAAPEARAGWVNGRGGGGGGSWVNRGGGGGWINGRGGGGGWINR